MILILLKYIILYRFKQTGSTLTSSNRFETKRFEFQSSMCIEHIFMFKFEFVNRTETSSSS